jgi:proteasome assembly chaperone (PAC2) family protein
VTLAHLFYIPGILLIGITIGYVLGARAARAEMNDRRARRRR